MQSTLQLSLQNILAPRLQTTKHLIRASGTNIAKLATQLGTTNLQVALNLILLH